MIFIYLLLMMMNFYISCWSFILPLVWDWTLVCTWIIILAIDPSSFLVDLKKGLIFYRDAYGGEIFFSLCFLCWHGPWMLDSPQVECHEVFVLLQILTSSWVQFSHNISNLGNLVRPLIVWMKDSQDGKSPFSIVTTSSLSSISSTPDLSLSLSYVILMKYE